MSFELERAASPRVLECTSLARAGAPHAFFTRHTPAEAHQGGLDAARLFQARQVHGSQVLVLQEDSDPDRIRDQEADALVTATAGQAVAVRTADCVPVLVFDPQRKVAAAIHAGWRGAAGGVVEATLTCMARTYGCVPAELLAAVGPAIGVCHFEVGAEVSDRFAHLAGVVRSNPETRPHIDLPRAVARLLQLQGIQQIDLCDSCTYCHPELYFSYRRDGSQAGRQLSAVGVP